jgi:hypothetical protein
MRTGSVGRIERCGFSYTKLTAKLSSHCFGSLTQPPSSNDLIWCCLGFVAFQGICATRGKEGFWKPGCLQHQAARRSLLPDVAECLGQESCYKTLAPLEKSVGAPHVSDGLQIEGSPKVAGSSCVVLGLHTGQHLGTIRICYDASPQSLLSHSGTLCTKKDPCCEWRIPRAHARAYRPGRFSEMQNPQTFN